jgi:hypothetical protein
MNDDGNDRPLTTAAIAGTLPPPPPPPVTRPGTPAMKANRTDAPAPSSAGHDARAPLLATDLLEEMRGRWKTIQSQFVDEPRRAVEQADGLVAETMKRLAEVFANERSGLEKQWGRNEEVSTEDLRIALQRYRSFFERLLDV